MSADAASDQPGVPTPTVVFTMIADFDTLSKLAATRKVKAVAMWCARYRIQTFRDTKHRPCTTITAIDRALNWPYCLT